MKKWATIAIISFLGIFGWMGIFTTLRHGEHAGTILALVIVFMASAFFWLSAMMEKSHDQGYKEACDCLFWE